VFRGELSTIEVSSPFAARPSVTLCADLAPETKPLVVAVEMGYGHLRAALSLAEALGEPVLRVDRAPLADTEEQKLWQRVRNAYELTSRLSSLQRRPTSRCSWQRSTPQPVSVRTKP